MKIKTFLGSKRKKLKDLENNLVVVGIPIESEGIFRKGTSKAPDAIRNASQMYYYKGFEGLYDPERDMFLLTEKKIIDVGDIIKKERKNLEHITNVMKQIIATQSTPVCIGGDHSITYPIIKAYSRDMAVIHLDAHSDFQRYQDIDAIPCGTVMRKVSELPYVKKIIHVGIRGYLNSSHALKDIISLGNIVITANELKKDGVEKVLKHIDPKIPHYISFDVDFLDPSICPGTTVPEPGGIDFEKAETLLHSIARKTKIIGIDCVEANPLYDKSQMSNIYITKLLISLMGELK